MRSTHLTFTAITTIIVIINVLLISNINATNIFHKGGFDVDASGLPTFTIKQCPSPLNWANTANSSQIPFFLSDCKGPAIQQTLVSACYDDESLYLHFECIDNNIYSPYTLCNEHLYNDDVVEVFIAPTLASGAVHNYIELELSPNSVLFAANVTNPDLTCSGIVDSPLPCSDFEYSAYRNDAENYWTGNITIPFSTLCSFNGCSKNIKPPSNTFQVNFFRVDTPLYQSKEYSCWSCDNSNPPCFHMPAYFGTLILS